MANTSKTPVKKEDNLFIKAIKALTPTEILTKKLTDRKKALDDPYKD